MIELIRKIPGKYVPETSFGFSLDKLPAERVSADFFQELSERFSAAEIPCYLIDSPIRTDGLFPVHGCKLIEPEILENLSQSRPGFVKSCISGLGRTIEQLSAKGVSAGVLDFDLSSPLSAEREALYLKILHGLAFVLEKTGFRLLLPFSIPNPSGEAIHQVSSFLKRTMLPWVRIRLDIHSHGLQPGYSPEKLVGALLGETASIRFVYLAETGNVLVPEHILPWIGALAVYGFRGPCFFTPAAASLNGLFSWVSSCETLLAKIEK